jgi:uncharacterized protein (TIGR03435 family)
MTRAHRSHVASAPVPRPALCATSLLFVILLSQAHPQSQDRFPVASVKANVSGLPYSQSSDQADGVTLVNETLRDLILFAYGLYDFQLTGGPDWVSRERFDVLARGDAPLSVEQKQARLRQLLADRFGLRARAETREQRVYRLTRTPGAKGPGLTPRECGSAGSFNLACGRGIAPADGGVVRLGGIPMARLAAVLGGVLGAAVLDYTGLDGAYDVDLQWRPDIGLSPDLTDEAKARIEGRPSLFVAVREQLGLSLQTHRGPVTVYVIERVARPTPD